MPAIESVWSDTKSKVLKNDFIMIAGVKTLKSEAILKWRLLIAARLR